MYLWYILTRSDVLTTAWEVVNHCATNGQKRVAIEWGSTSALEDNVRLLTEVFVPNFGGPDPIPGLETDEDFFTREDMIITGSCCYPI